MKKSRKQPKAVKTGQEHLTEFWNDYFDGAYTDIDGVLYSGIVYMSVHAEGSLPYIDGGCETTFTELGQKCHMDWRCVKEKLIKLQSEGLIRFKVIGRKIAIQVQEMRKEKKNKKKVSPSTPPFSIKKKEKKEKSAREKKEETLAQFSASLSSRSGSLEERRAAFQAEVGAFVQQYGRDICNEFFEHWVEPTQDGERMRFELEKTWKTSIRLSKWKRYDLRIKSKTDSVAKVQEPSDQKERERKLRERQRDKQQIDAVPYWAYIIAHENNFLDDSNADAIEEEMMHLEEQGKLSKETQTTFIEWRQRRNILKQEFDKKYGNEKNK